MTEIAVERNLHFVILAQLTQAMGRNAILEGLKAWKVDSDCDLSSILVEQKWITEEQRQMLNQVVDLQLDQHDGNWDQCLGSLCKRPAIRDELNQLREMMLTNDGPHATEMASCLSELIRVTLSQLPTRIPPAEPQLSQLDTDNSQSDTSIPDDRSIDPNAASAGATETASERPTAPPKPPQPDSGTSHDPATGSKATGSNRTLTDRFERINEKGFPKVGGIGQVWLAKDKELGRQVAIKEIKPDLANRIEIQQRFRREAKITSQLAHPGIVAVYDSGNNSQGQPFYAMKFIPDETLREAIKNFHQRRGTGLRGDSSRGARKKGAYFSDVQFRQLLVRFVDVCEAVNYAHGHGVLHRDLKPDNVLLGKYGETLVADWGLAKATGHDLYGVDEPDEVDVARLSVLAVDDADLTLQTQGPFGTPPYMSPEQAAGNVDEVDQQSDVYSLGATLYEILTGKPPIEAPQQLKTNEKIKHMLELATKGDFLHPRKKNREAPFRLEAICLKAMSFDKSDRYSSAQELAKDVKRWQADEPVSAWAEPLSRRIFRWGRHHQKTVSALIAALTVALLLLLVESTSLVQQRDSARTDAGTAKQLLETERKLREAEIDSQVAQKGKKAAEEAKKIEADLRVSAEIERDKAIKAEKNEAKQRILAEAARAEAEDEKNKANDARDAQNKQRLLAVAAQMKAEKATKMATGAQAELKIANDALKNASDALSEANEKLIADHHNLVFEVHSQLVNLPGTGAVRQDLLRKALNDLEDVSTQYLADKTRNQRRMFAKSELAALYVKIGSGLQGADGSVQAGSVETVQTAWSTAEKLYEEAREIGKELLKDATAKDANRVALDLSLINLKLGKLSQRMGDDLPTTEKYFLAAIEMLKKLPNQADPIVRRDLSVAHVALGDLFNKSQKDNGNAKKHYDDAFKIRELLAEEESDLAAQVDLALVLERLAALAEESSDNLTAREKYVLAVGIRQKVKAKSAEPDPQRNSAFATTLYNLARVSSKLAESPNGDEKSKKMFLEAAKKAFEEAIKIAEKEDKKRETILQTAFDKFRRQNELNVVSSRLQAGALTGLGNVCWYLNETEEVLKHYELALKFRQRLAGWKPSDGSAQKALATAYKELGHAYEKLDQSKEKAVSNFEEAVKILKLIDDPDRTQRDWLENAIRRLKK